MSIDTRMPEKIGLTIDGSDIQAAPGMSLLQAWISNGMPLTENVGCMGQGACGACRVLVRRPDERLATTALACETLVEQGMQVAFVDYFESKRRHDYNVSSLVDSWQIIEEIDQFFPEAKNCRHCSGCDRACPKGIPVQEMVAMAVKGEIARAAELIDHCVMCNLCVAACPEQIDPAHLGQFLRRTRAAMTLRPPELLLRLHQIETGGQMINTDRPVSAAKETDK